MLSEARLSWKQGTQKPTKTAPPQKGLGESSGPILREEHEDPRLQDQCRQVIHQLNAITTATSPVKPSDSKPAAREGELGTSATKVPTSPMLMSPNFVQLAMDQCGLKLNEWGELVQTNTEIPYCLLPTTLGFQNLLVVVAGLDPGWLRSCTTP